MWSIQVCVNTMPRRKYISSDLREAIVAQHESGKGYRPFTSNLNCSRSYYSEKKYWNIQDRGHLPRSGTLYDQNKVTSVDIWNIKVHDSTIRKRFNLYVLFGRVAWWISLFSLKRTWQHSLSLQYLNKPEDFWNNVLWTEESKVETFGHYAKHHAWRKQRVSYLLSTAVVDDDLGSFCSYRTQTPWL